MAISAVLSAINTDQDRGQETTGAAGEVVTLCQQLDDQLRKQGLNSRSVKNPMLLVATTWLQLLQIR